MATLTIQLSGTPQIRLDEQPLIFESRKALALLAYLALRDGPQRRETLATFFWPESDTKRARGALRYTLSLLKKGGLAPWLQINREAITLHNDPLVDVQQLRHHLQQARSGTAPSLDQLEAAWEWYSGPFMNGFGLKDSIPFDEWQFFEQERLQHDTCWLLENLVAEFKERGASAPAIEHAQLWLAEDPLNEGVHQTLIELYLHSGQRSAALRQYQQCVNLLEAELGVPPAPQTHALLEEVQGLRQVATAVQPPPPSHPLPTPPHLPQLPPAPAPLLGREDVLEKIEQLCLQPDKRLITVLGPGGIGKTRLSLAVATRLAPHYTHGCGFVRLAPLEGPAELPSTIAEAVGLKFYEGRHPEEQLVDFLAEREMLLVFDNVEHLLTTDFLPLWLKRLLAQAPGITCLATSREPIQLKLEQRITLSGLETELPAASMPQGLPPAQQLFLDTARRIRPDFSPDSTTLNAVCRFVAGHPLALELAAGLVSSLPLADIYTELQHNLDILATSHRDAHSRHHSITAVFDSSFQALTSTQQTLFVSLAIFQESFTRQAAAEVCGATLTDLTAFVRKSLLTLDSRGRYRLQELLQQYALDKLKAQPERWAQLLQDHAITFANHLDRQLRRWQEAYDAAQLTPLAADVDNLQQAWLTLLQQPETVLFQTFTDDCWQFYRFLGQFERAAHMLQQALAQGAALPQPLLASWYHKLGEAYFGLGEMETSRQALAAALQQLGEPLSQSFGGQLTHIATHFARHTLNKLRPQTATLTTDPPQESILCAIYDRLAQVGYLTNDLLLSGYAVMRGVTAAEKLGTHPALAIAYADMLILSGLLGRQDRAQGYAQRATEIAQRFQDPPTSAAVALRHSIYANSNAQWEVAERTGAQALQLFAQLEDMRNWGDGLASLGCAYYLRGTFAKGLAAAQELEGLASVSHNVEHRVWSLLGRCTILLAQGETAVALADLQDHAHLLERVTGNAIHQPLYDSLLAIAQLQQGELARAEAAAERALQVTQQRYPVFFVLLLLYTNLAEVFTSLWEQSDSESNRRQTRAEEASRRLQRFAQLHPIGRPSSLLIQGRIAHQRGALKSALVLWRDAFGSAASLKMPYAQWQAARLLSTHLAEGTPEQQRFAAAAADLARQWERVG